MLPQAFKKQLAPILQDGFVLKRAVFQKCLELYPIAEWNILSAKVNKLNRFNKKNDEDDFEQNFSFFYDYTGSEQLTGTTKVTAFDEIFERITQDIFNASLAKW